MEPKLRDVEASSRARPSGRAATGCPKNEGNMHGETACTTKSTAPGGVFQQRASARARGSSEFLADRRPCLRPLGEQRERSRARSHSYAVTDSSSCLRECRPLR